MSQFTACIALLFFKVTALLREMPASNEISPPLYLACDDHTFGRRRPIEAR